MSKLKDKFEFVRGKMTRLQLTQQEQNWLLGGSGFTCGIDHIDPSTDAAKAFEARLDLICKLFGVMDTLHYPDDIKGMAEWLRSPHELLDNKSRLQYFHEDGDPSERILAAGMDEGP